MLNNIVLLRKIQINYCRIPESPYICTVFFIVLDLRLTKDWLSGIDSLFLCPYTSFFPYLDKFMR